MCQYTYDKRCLLIKAAQFHYHLCSLFLQAMQSQNLEYKMDTTFPDEPFSICGSQNEIKDYERNNPLSEASEMINEGNVELTKAIDMVRQYNLDILIDGKNLFNKKSVVNEQNHKLNQPAEIIDAKENENSSYTETIKVQPQKWKKMLQEF